MFTVTRTIAILCVLSLATSCTSVSESSKMKRAEGIEMALRKLLADQRQAIEKDAPFVYETDVFAGGARTSERDRLGIGKWTVAITGENAKAKIEKRFGGPGHFESEVIEVTLRLQHSSAIITDWRAYQGRGKSD
jgi:hypothetical protein